MEIEAHQGVPQPSPIDVSSDVLAGNHSLMEAVYNASMTDP